MAKSTIGPPQHSISNQLKSEWVDVRRHFLPMAEEQKSPYAINCERKHKEAIKVALTKGYFKTLNEQLILKLQRSSEGDEAALQLQEVQRIDVSHGSVQALHQASLLACQNLRVCNLRGCYLIDIAAFYGCSSLLKLDLADNQISQLPGGDFWNSLSSLKVLYLHGNVLFLIDDLVKLGNSSSLLVLTLYDTPLALIPNYRHHVVNSIFSLKALDRHVVSDEEIIENLRLPRKFGSLGNNLKLQLYSSYMKLGTSVKEEVHQVFQLLLAADRILAKFSPVTIIQRYVRGWLLRTSLLRTADQRIREFLQKRKKHVPIKSFKESVVPTSSNRTNPSRISAAIFPPLPSLQLHQVNHPSPPPSTPYSTWRYPRKNRMPAVGSKTAHEHTTVIDLKIKLQNIEEHAKAAQQYPSRVGSRTRILGARKKSKDKKEGKQVSSKDKETQQSGREASGVLKNSEQIEVKEGTEQGKKEETGQGNKEGRSGTDQDKLEVGEMTIKGVPAHIIKGSVGHQYTRCKEHPETLSKQHKELKIAAQAARNKPRNEHSTRSGKKDDIIKKDLLYRRMSRTLNLQHLEDVEKYYKKERDRQEQEERNRHVSQQRCERKARSKNVKEEMAKKREKLVEWAGEHWNLMACHAEDAECEQNLLCDQIALMKQQHQMQSEKEKDSKESAKTKSQKFIMLSNSIKNEEMTARKAVNNALYLETVSRRQAEWAREREERRRAEEQQQMKLLAQSRLDKQIQNARQIQKAADHAMETRTKVLEGRAKRDTGHKAMEESKQEVLAACLSSKGEGSKPFILQTGTLPSAGYGVSLTAKSPSRFIRIGHTQKKVNFAADTQEDPVLIALGSKPLHTENDHQLHLPSEDLSERPTSSAWTMFTELESSSIL